MCSHCLFPVVVTSLEQVNCYHLVTRLMTVTDLLQVVPTRLIQAVCNKLLYELVVINLLINNLLRADDIRLVGTTCCEPVGLVNLVTIQDDNNLFQTCQQLGTSSANSIRNCISNSGCSNNCNG
jgi:hypothetical protein